jgi:hypothetical protein
MSECSFRWAGRGYEEALPVVTLWGRRRIEADLGGLVGADAIDAFSREARAMVPA